MLDVTIMKNNENKYCFQIFIKNELRYSSEYLYDDVFLLENNNNTESFLRESFILLKIGTEYGVFDGWKQRLIIPIQYKYIENRQLSSNIIFVCKKTNNKYIFLSKTGSKIIEKEFDDVMYMGYYYNIKKYLYMIKSGNNVGIMNTDGIIIVPEDEKYVFEFFYKEGDYIVLKLNLVGTLINFYDIYSSNGILLFSNINNYEYLGIY